MPLPVTAVLAGLALAVGLAGCSTEPNGQGTLDSGSSAAPATDGSGADSSDGADGGADSSDGPAAPSVPDAVGSLEVELRKLAGTSPTPDRAGMTGAFAAAGFEPASVEVSADRTPTGLKVDAMQAAAVRDAQCIFGEVRDGAVTVSVLPVLSDGGCFIGN